MSMDELDFESSVAEAEAPRPSEAAIGVVEYDAPNGDKWHVERGADLIADFELGTTDSASLTKWHGALCNQEAAWNIVCRLYGNSPLYGVEEPDELRVWTIAELAEKRGVEPREIDAYLEGAKSYWKRVQLETRSTENIRARPAPDEETSDQLLREHGFGEIENKEERAYIAGRCLELQLWLDDDRLRAAARSLIQQETVIFFILDPTVRELRSEIREKIAKKGSIDKENSQLMSLLKERRDAQTALDSSMKVLGLADAAGGDLRKKLAFNDCLSILIKAIQEYYDETDRQLIDGLFTAAEVELLTTPTELRPVQYRPDLILRAMEAKEHLWESDWSPTPISRRACRKLASGFAQGLAEARSQEGEVTQDEAIEEETLLSEVAGATPAVTGPIEAPPGSVIPATVLPRASTADETAAMFT
jgi:hypothetical protein